MRRGTAVVATLALVLLPACGANDTSREPAAATVTDAPTERVVEFWYMPNGPDPAAHLQSEVERFEAEHPDIRVQLEELSWESALTRIITAATSGSGPDVLQIGTTWVPGIAGFGGLRELTLDELEAFGGHDAFVAPSWTSTSVQGSDAVVAVPWFLDTRAGFYRTDLFEELGLDPAEAFADWDAFEATLRAIQDDGRMAPLALSGANDFNVVHDLGPWLWASGGGFIDEDAVAPAIGSAASIEGVDRYQRLVATFNHPDALAMGVDEAQQLFITGEAAITFGESSVVNEVRSSDAPDGAAANGWATFPFPSGPSGRHTFLGGSNLAVFAATPEPGAALAWVQFLTSESSQLRYAQAIGMLPARTSALEHEQLRGDAGMRPFVTQLADGRQYPPLAEWLHVEVALQHHLGRMWQEVTETGAALERSDVAARMRAAAREVAEALNGEE